MNHLEKEFVPYPEALELKQLRFDKPCLAFWNFFTNEFNYNSQPSTFTSADVVQLPTFSQAFRWFREKHHLIGGVEYIGGATPSTTWWDIYVVGHFNIDASKMTMKYQPYEEAELTCLRKLIEIVKNK